MIFRNLEITGCGISGEDSWGADGIAVERGQNIVVEDCDIHDNGGDGIDLNSRNFDGRVSGIVVRRNRVIRNHKTGIKLWAGGRIENNVLWGQGNSPISIGAFPGDYELINNTVAFNMWNSDYSVRNYALVAAYPNDDTGVSAQINLKMLNNIFAFNSNEDMGGSTGIYLGEGVTLAQEGHNLYWSRSDGEIQAEFVQGESWFSRDQIANGSWSLVTGQGVGNITQDPQFISHWPNVDLHLDVTSPAINNGYPIDTLFTDTENHPRPSGDQYDIGAYEYQYPTKIDERPKIPEAITLFSNIPNPFNSSTIIRYALENEKFVELDIFDILGKHIKTLFNGYRSIGIHDIEWNGRDNSGEEATSGLYFLKLKVDNAFYTRRLLLLR